MRYVTFHGEQISRLGFGFMRLPVHNGDQSQVDYGKAEEMVLYALENGVNYYDTAYPYHNGHSEMTLGRILAENRIRRPEEAQAFGELGYQFSPERSGEGTYLFVKGDV